MSITPPTSIFRSKATITRVRKSSNETDSVTTVGIDLLCKKTTEYKVILTANGPVTNLVTIIDFRGDVAIQLEDRIAITGGPNDLQVRRVYNKAGLTEKPIMTLVWCW
jgi:hypothetical protein